jgi:2-methylcitrate dehydratase PrpD
VHPAVDAALALRNRGFTLDDMAGVTVYLSARASNAIGGRDDAGRAAKIAPTGMVDAQTSVPYNVAVALCRGAVTLADFSDKAIRDESTLRIAAMVDEAVDPALDSTSDMITPVIVELKLRDRTVFSQRVDHALGHPLNPCSPEQMEAKFRSCLAHVRPAQPAKDVDDLLTLLSHLEDVDDIGALMRAVDDAERP